MTERDRDNAELIESIIGKKMKPIYWLIGIILVIFFSVSAPLTYELINVAKIQQTKMSIDLAEKSFLNKLEYYQIERDEHRMVIEAFQDHPKAIYIYEQINDNIADRLGFKYTTRSAK